MAQAQFQWWWREVASIATPVTLSMGWALKSPPSRRTKFTDKQKQYLNVKFQIGERTGKKAEPTDKGYNCLLVLPAHCTHNDYRHIACRIKSTFVGKNSD